MNVYSLQTGYQWQTKAMIPPCQGKENRHSHTWKVKWFFIIRLLVLCIIFADFLEVELSLDSTIPPCSVKMHHCFFLWCWIGLLDSSWGVFQLWNVCFGVRVINVEHRVSYISHLFWRMWDKLTAILQMFGRTLLWSDLIKDVFTWGKLLYWLNLADPI